MNIKWFTCFLILFFDLVQIDAQRFHPGLPISWQYSLKAPKSSRTIKLSANENSKRLINNTDLTFKPLIVASEASVDADILKEGSWQTMADGSKICRMTFHYEGAKALLCYFSVFEPVKGASLYIYSADKKILLGAFDQNSSDINGVLSVAPVAADYIAIEYHLPAEAKNAGRIYLKNINVDLDGKSTLNNSSSTVTDCYTNVNCTSAEDWVKEKNAVVRLLINNQYYCTGALINNAANSDKYYILTANHCISSNALAQNTIIDFNLESAGCDNATVAPINTISGATLRATATDLDFSLIEISKPPFAFQPYLAGWNIGSPTTAGYVTIHHPEGGIKKISSTTQNVSVSSFDGYKSNSHWEVPQWTKGSTAEGSSGAPLFNSNHQIIGDLTGGAAECGNALPDYFARLSASWNTYSSTSQQLKAWLDPASTGVTAISGRDPYNSIHKGSFLLTNMGTSEKDTLIECSGNIYPTMSKVYDGIADLFTLSGTYHIEGCFVDPYSIANHSGQSSLKFCIWQNSNNQPFKVYEKSIDLTSLTAKSLNYIALDSVVKTSGSVWAVFTWEGMQLGDTITIAHAPFSDTRNNTVYVLNNSTMKSIDAITSSVDKTSLALWLSAWIGTDIETPTVTTTQSLTIYPNPAHEQFTVVLPSDAQQIDIYSVDGITVYNKHDITGNEQMQINFSDMPVGIYFVQVTGASKFYKGKVIHLR
jgi:V8-like Glu-specific endopeptidase